MQELYDAVNGKLRSKGQRYRVFEESFDAKQCFEDAFVKENYLITIPSRENGICQTTLLCTLTVVPVIILARERLFIMILLGRGSWYYSTLTITGVPASKSLWNSRDLWRRHRTDNLLVILEKAKACVWLIFIEC